MSLQTLAKILRPFGVATSRQFLGRHLPRKAAGHRTMVGYTQVKRASTKDELSSLVLGLGVLSTSIVWVRGNFTSSMSNISLSFCFVGSALFQKAGSLTFMVDRFLYLQTIPLDFSI